jgi:hypothetical protein
MEAGNFLSGRRLAERLERDFHVNNRLSETG